MTERDENAYPKSLLQRERADTYTAILSIFTTFYLSE